MPPSPALLGLCLLAVPVLEPDLVQAGLST